MTFPSDAGERICISLRGRTFIGARIIIGTIEIRTESLLRKVEDEPGGMCCYLLSYEKGRSSSDAFIVSFNMERSKTGKPPITIRVSARISNVQEHANMDVRAAQMAIDSDNLRPIDSESALKNSVSKLSNTLGEVVKVIFGKMDALAEVCFCLQGAINTFPECSFTVSFTPTRTSHGRRVRPCIG